jgi:hypothetical protein
VDVLEVQQSGASGTAEPVPAPDEKRATAGAPRRPCRYCICAKLSRLAGCSYPCDSTLRVGPTDRPHDVCFHLVPGVCADAPETPAADEHHVRWTVNL